MKNCSGHPRQLEDFIKTPWIVSACSANDAWQFISTKWKHINDIANDGLIEAFETKKDAKKWIKQHLSDKYRFPKAATSLEICKVAPYIQDGKCIYEVVNFERIKVEQLESWLAVDNHD